MLHKEHHNPLTDQRCFNHGEREAAACCLECKRYYCRECVTEHEGRVLCSSCLVQLTDSEKDRVSRLIPVFRFVQFAIGFVALWLFFYIIGQGLLTLPASFHEGAIWQVSPFK